MASPANQRQFWPSFRDRWIFSIAQEGWEQKSLRSHSQEKWSLFWAYICTLKVHFIRKIYFKKGEMFVKTTYYQDIMTISMNVKRYFWKNKIQVSFHNFPPFAETDWACNNVIFRPFLGHLINRSHSPSYTINIFHNLLSDSLKYTSRNISGQLSFDWLHVLKGYFTLCTKRRIMGT